MAAISVNLYTKYTTSEATIDTPAAGPVRVQLETKYPDDGVVTLKLQLAKAAAFPVYVRIPSWAKGATSILLRSHTQTSARLVNYRPIGQGCCTRFEWVQSAELGGRAYLRVHWDCRLCVGWFGGQEANYERTA